MKPIITNILVFYVIFGIGFAQNAELNIKKLCIDGDVSNLVYIHYQNNMVMAKIDQGNSYAGLNAITGEQEYIQRLPSTKAMGFGICGYGSYAMFSCLNNTYNEKTKTTILNETIFFIDPATGNKVDSIKVPYNIVTYSSIRGKSNKLCFIVQESDTKLRAVIADKQTGQIKYRLFSQVKEAGFDVIPNALVVDNNEKLVAVGTANGGRGFFLYSLSTGKLLLNLKGKGDIHSIVFSADGKRCYYIQQKKIHVVNTSTLKLEKVIALTNEGVFMALHPNGKTMAVTGFGTPTELCLVDLESSMIQKTAFRSRGGAPYYSKEGKLFVPSQQGVQCFVNPDKLPYLAMISFDDIEPSDNTLPASGAAISKGQRVFALYSGDGKYYSATVNQVESNGIMVIFDDGYKTSVAKAAIKPLPSLKVGDKISCKWTDGKYYPASIFKIEQEKIQVKYDDGTLEWTKQEKIMQVE